MSTTPLIIAAVVAAVMLAGSHFQNAFPAKAAPPASVSHDAAILTIPAQSFEISGVPPMNAALVLVMDAVLVTLSELVGGMAWPVFCKHTNIIGLVVCRMLWSVVEFCVCRCALWRTRRLWSSAARARAARASWLFMLNICGVL